MSIGARIYVSAVILIGACVAINEFIRWESQDLIRFSAYLVLSILASRLKVALPAITGTLSVLFIFILFGIVELSLPEALFMGCTATLIQCFWHNKQRPKTYQVLFNLGSMAIAIATASSAYHSKLLYQGHLDAALTLLVTATVFFAMNTFPVAAAIALTEQKSLRQVWRECYFWSFPYYLLGAGIAGGASAINRHFGWQTALLAVPEHIISKPGKLTREEFEKMKIHPVVGAEILERVRFPYPVTPIVRSHHEKWNGLGYPDGLKGEEIPMGARILAAVDCLDALASDRQYRRALPLDEAMQKVVSESGVSFDPRIVEVLNRRYIALEQMAQAQQVEKAKLSIDLKIERGLEPAAGFEKNKAQASNQPEKPADFLNSIAAARQEVQNLFELAQDLGNSLSLNETLSLLAIRLKRMIPYDSLAIYVLRDDVLRAEYVNGENFRLLSALEIPLGQGLSGWVADNRKPIINGNPSVEPGYLNDETKFTTMRSALSVPLIGLNGTVSVLTLYHNERDAFSKDHLRILLAIVPKVALSIENALKYQQAESSASTDYMTGLPNARSLFLHLDGELARCRRLNSPLVVLVCDMNGFKQVNDKYGHLEGNKVLHTVALKLKESCREYDYVARMGGDEFVLVLPGLKLDQVQQKIGKLRAITAEAGREVCGTETTLSLSVGHALFPDDGADADQLLSEADRRMYIAKQKEKLSVVGPRGFEFEPTGTW
jgi:diguanylate cyclase (GGDEF)-like protein